MLKRKYSDSKWFWSFSILLLFILTWFFSQFLLPQHHALSFIIIAVIACLHILFLLDKWTQSNADLRISEARLRLATQAGNIGIWDWDIQKNTITWDTSMYRMYGIDEHEFKGAYEAWQKTVHPEDLAFAEKEIQAALQGQRDYAPEFRIIRPDGEIRYIQAASQTLRDAAGNALRMIGTNVDITDRKKAEAELLESQNRYQLVFENSGTANAIFDSDCRLTLQNQKSQKFLGAQPGEAIGKSALEIFGPNRGPVVTERMKRVLSTGLTEIFETEFKLATGKKCFSSTYCPLINSRNEIIGIQVISQDITERKNAETAIAAEKEQLSVTLKSIGDGVITTDIQGRIQILNKVAEELTGWSQTDACNQPLERVFNIINEITRQPCENPVVRVIQSGEIVELENHTILIAKDGTERMIADSGAPIKNAQSETIGVVLVFRDMTEKYKMQIAIQQTAKLESIGLLAGGIAHDFNNLLSGIFSYMELASDALKAKDINHAQLYFDKSFSVFDRVRALTHQLLTFSKGGKPIKKRIQLLPLLDQSVKFALSGSNLVCQFELTDTLWDCDCDENQIGQVIDNVIINAKQAMPEGGRVLVSAENLTILPETKAHFNHKGNYIHIAIRDHGTGMDPEVMAHVFDPFFTTKETGHGLGLATAFSIIHHHNGWMEVESQKGKGSTFHIYLPAAESDSEPLQVTELRVQAATGTILIMDDEDYIRDVLQALLTQIGFHVLVAANGESALQQFKQADENQTPIKACILDLTIPGGLGGKEVIQVLKKQNPQTVFIASSGYSQDPVMAMPGEYGFTDKLAKPYRKKELFQLLKSLGLAELKEDGE